MRILLTGVAGFVGSHLADRLIHDGHDVVGVDNLVTGRRSNIEHLDAHPSFHFVECDVSEPLDDDAIGHRRIHWILHFASPASPPKYLALPVETLRVNAEGSRHLLDLARRRGAGFFLASTSEVYGDPAHHPQPEEYWGNVNPIGPRSVYDEAKRYAEAVAVAYHRAHHVPIRIIRIFNTYGPRMDPDDGRVVTNFIGQALRGEPLTAYGDGSQTRSFQYVDDLVEGVVRYLPVDHPGPINLGNPEEYSMVELATLVRELTGANVPIEFRPLPLDDPRQRRPDIALARRLLHWEPRVAAREGLARTIEDLRRHYERAGETGETPVHTAAGAIAARAAGSQPGGIGSH
jgi:nucleoside-diphosphate-sugar epimerase